MYQTWNEDLLSTDWTGVTSVSHNVMSQEVLNNGFEDPGSFSLNPVYIASIDQLKALTAASQNCSQFIKVSPKQIIWFGAFYERLLQKQRHLGVGPSKGGCDWCDRTHPPPPFFVKTLFIVFIFIFYLFILLVNRGTAPLFGSGSWASLALEQLSGDFFFLLFFSPPFSHTHLSNNLRIDLRKWSGMNEFNLHQREGGVGYDMNVLFMEILYPLFPTRKSQRFRHWAINTPFGQRNIKESVYLRSRLFYLVWRFIQEWSSPQESEPVSRIVKMSQFWIDSG